MRSLPIDFKKRMEEQLGKAADEFFASYELPPIRGIRINTLKLSKERFYELCPWSTLPSPTLDEGLILTDEVEHIGSHPYHIAGMFYVQEPSAMSVIEEAQIEPGMRVLDLCAAPGGKSGGIAARLKGSGLLVSNEIVRNRAIQLARNLERLGVCNAVVINAHPDEIAANLPCYFDRVIVDAPCSGEGMFRKDETAIEEWSLEHVASCATRQSAIIESASACVAPGGKLIYSTCTFSPDENEGVIDAFLKSHPEFSLEMMMRLYPHTDPGEGHFVARLVRNTGCGGGLIDFSSEPQKKRRSKLPERNKFAQLDKAQKEAADEFFDAALLEKPNERFLSVFGSRLMYIPFEYPRALMNLPIIAFGVEIGEFIKMRLKPSHSFFMASHGLRYAFSLDLAPGSNEIAAFLRGETLDLEAYKGGTFAQLRGYVPVTVCGCPIGFGKAVDGVLKNHLPKGLSVNSYQ